MIHMLPPKLCRKGVQAICDVTATTSQENRPRSLKEATKKHRTGKCTTIKHTAVASVPVPVN
ncbi:hypothetical protein Hamer_G003906, partial [Homarus americanus]